jgi:hypothetical protein
MDCVHIQHCRLSVEQQRRLVDSLTDIKLTDSQSGELQIECDVVNDISSMLQSLCNPDQSVTMHQGGAILQSIANQGRYLLYVGDTTPIPKFLIILSQKIQSHIAHDSRGRTHKPTKTTRGIYVKVFICGVAAHGQHQHRQLGHGSSNLLKDMLNPGVKNSCILCELLVFKKSNAVLCSGTYPERFVTGTASDKSSHMICVPQFNGSTEVLPVSLMGLNAVREVLRNLDQPMGSDNYWVTIIAQNKLYTLGMSADIHMFRLCLYETDNFLTCKSTSNEPVALVTMSHGFHALDRVIEQERIKFIPHGKDHSRVTGMLAVTQALLRHNIVPASVQSIGSNCDATTYADMDVKDIAEIFHAMGLVTDDRSISKVLNRIHKRVVVGHVLMKMDHSALTGLDFIMHQSSALRYAICHQNTTIMGILNKTLGVDMHEIGTALYSGISFCHSCAYDSNPTEVNPGVFLHIINGSDFSKERVGKLNSMIIADAGIVSCTETVTRWTRLRHNFRVPGETNVVLDIECHTAEDGLLFFRRVGSPRITGAVYIIPSLVPKFTDETLQENTTVSMQRKLKPHALMKVVKQLVSHTPASYNALLRQATEMLCHINCLCIHNKHIGSVSGGGGGTARKHHHQLMRKVWLHTNMLTASVICGGTQNEEFYSIYGYLSNLSLLPLDSNGYWSTTPYT